MPLKSVPDDYFKAIRFNTAQGDILLDYLEKDVRYSVRSYDTFNAAFRGTFNIPTVPMDLTAQEVSPDRVVLTYKSSRDFDGIKSYVLYRDGKEIGQSESNSFSDMAVVAGVKYVYTVRALNQDDSLSASANFLVVEVPVPMGDSRPVKRVRDIGTPSIQSREQNAVAIFYARSAEFPGKAVETVRSPSTEQILFSMYSMEQGRSGAMVSGFRPDVMTIGVGNVERAVREGFRAMSGGSRYFRISPQARVHQSKIRAIVEAIRSKFPMMDNRNEGKKEDLSMHTEEMLDPLGSGIVRSEEMNAKVGEMMGAQQLPEPLTNRNSAALSAVSVSREIPAPAVWRDAVAQAAAPRGVAVAAADSTAFSVPGVGPEVLLKFADTASAYPVGDIFFGARNLARRAASLMAAGSPDRSVPKVPAADLGSRASSRDSGSLTLLYVFAGMLALGVLSRI